MKRKDMLWYVSCAMFVLLLVLGMTGLINWLILPRGSEMASGFLISLRHVMRDVHEWTGVLFFILLGIHLWFHKGYIVSQLKMHTEK